MQGHYFDIETYSPGEKPDPLTDKILTIQFQKIDIKTGEPEGRLQILKLWEEGSEEKMLRFIHKWFFSQNPWRFIPIGFNLNFEFKFLAAKFKEYNIDDREMGNYLENYPHIDLKSLAVIKKGSFIGASLSSISDKVDDGHVIKEYYETKQYDKIVEYVEIETKSFIELYKKVAKNIDNLL